MPHLPALLLAQLRQHLLEQGNQDGGIHKVKGLCHLHLEQGLEQLGPAQQQMVEQELEVQQQVEQLEVQSQ